MNNTGSALCAIPKSLGSRAGAFASAFPARWVVRKAPKTAFSFIPSAMTGFTTCAFLSRNRASLKEAFEGLELCERKLSCTVLRELDGSNPVRLLGDLGHRAAPARIGSEPPDQRFDSTFRGRLRSTGAFASRQEHIRGDSSALRGRVQAFENCGCGLC
jgi:hypothetical protein